MISFVLNLPYTVVGLLMALASVPRRISFHKNPYAFVVHAKRFWWTFGYLKGAHAMTLGHTVILGPDNRPDVLHHELVHVQQYERLPIIFPLLYHVEFLKRGYRANRYEQEAYQRAGNAYRKN